ncbi:MAG: hypothetical protein ACE5IJ_10785 [Thermoplasmata archaeon]
MSLKFLAERWGLVLKILFLFLTFAFESLAGQFVSIDVLPMTTDRVTLFSFLSAASLTGFLYLLVYEHVHERSQRREWQRRSQLKLWDDVYVPLYNDIMEDGDALRDLRTVQPRTWSTINKSHRERILDKELRPRILDYYNACDSYSSSWLEISSKADGIMSECLIDALNFDLTSEPGWQPLVQTIAEIWHHLLRQDWADFNYWTKFESRLATFNPLFGGKSIDPTETLGRVRTRVLERDDIQFLLSERDRADELRKKLLDPLGDIIEAPYDILRYRS